MTGLAPIITATIDYEDWLSETLRLRRLKAERDSKSDYFKCSRLTR